MRSVLQCAFFSGCDKCCDKICLKTGKIRYYAWSGSALKTECVVCHVLTLLLDLHVPLECRVAFLCSLCCRTLHLECHTHISHLIPVFAPRNSSQLTSTESFQGDRRIQDDMWPPLEWHVTRSSSNGAPVSRRKC